MLCRIKLFFNQLICVRCLFVYIYLNRTTFLIFTLKQNNNNKKSYIITYIKSSNTAQNVEKKLIKRVKLHLFLFFKLHYYVTKSNFIDWGL